MKKYMLLIPGLLLFSGISVHSQDLVSGDLGFLKGQKALQIEYLYDGMTVGKMSEVDYVNKKVSEYNAKEPGKGDKWLTAWKGDREAKFQPKFEELFARYTADKGVKSGESVKDAQYVMVVKTTFTEPGFNIGIMHQDANINIEVTFYEIANRDKELAKVVNKKIPGSTGTGYDFDTGGRIAEGYAKAGKNMGKFLFKLF
jgi:hypothetical protein